MMNIETGVFPSLDVCDVSETVNSRPFQCRVLWEPYLRPKVVNRAGFTPCLYGMTSEAVDKDEINLRVWR